MPFAPQSTRVCAWVAVGLLLFTAPVFGYAQSNDNPDPVSLAFTKRVVKIYFKDGAVSDPIEVDWNSGWGDVVAEYRSFKAGGKQSRFEFQVRSRDQSRLSIFYIDFTSIHAMVERLE